VIKVGHQIFEKKNERLLPAWPTSFYADDFFLFPTSIFFLKETKKKM